MRRYEIISLLRKLRNGLKDWDRAEGYEGLSYPSMTVIVEADDSGRWGYRTGDNSFIGTYPRWAIVVLTKHSDCYEVAKEILDKLGGTA